jgi:hypothetical protein
VHLKNLAFWVNQKLVFFVHIFRANPTVLGVLVGFCWPIGVTAALLERLLPSDGHKLVLKKNGNLGPEVLHAAHVLAGRVILNLYHELPFCPRQ